MSDKSLPYLTVAKHFKDAIPKIQAAAVPAKLDKQFVEEVLKVKGGPAGALASYFKKLGLADSTGAPTNRYSELRIKSKTGQAVAGALREAYGELEKHDVKFYERDDAGLKDILKEVTGRGEKDSIFKKILATVRVLISISDFSGSDDRKADEGVEATDDSVIEQQEEKNSINQNNPLGNSLRFSHTININLPATSEPAVYHAIFRALKENLL